MPNSSPTVARRRWYCADAGNQSVSPLKEDLRLLRQNGVNKAETLIPSDGKYGSVFADVPSVAVRPVESSSTKIACPFYAEKISTAPNKCEYSGEAFNVSLHGVAEAKQSKNSQSMVFMNAVGGRTPRTIQSPARLRSSDSFIPNASAIRCRVATFGVRSPRSRKPMYVRWCPVNSANFSWDRLFSSRRWRIVSPILLLRVCTPSSIEIGAIQCSTSNAPATFCSTYTK